MILFLMLMMVLILMTACTKSSEEKEITNATGFFRIYDDVESLYSMASVVVSGTVIETSVKWLDDMLDPGDPTDEKANPGGERIHAEQIYTVHQFKIENVYKGEWNRAEIIEVKQIGGEKDNKLLVVENISYLEEDKEYLLFLETYEKSPASLLNPIQGMYEIKDEKMGIRIIVWKTPINR